MNCECKSLKTSGSPGFCCLWHCMYGGSSACIVLSVCWLHKWTCKCLSFIISVWSDMSECIISISSGWTESTIRPGLLSWMTRSVLKICSALWLSDNSHPHTIYIYLYSSTYIGFKIQTVMITPRCIAVLNIQLSILECCAANSIFANRKVVFGLSEEKNSATKIGWVLYTTIEKRKNRRIMQWAKYKPNKNDHIANNVKKC